MRTLQELAAVLPVFVTGLYCGDSPDVGSYLYEGVLPVFVTGLYCGRKTSFS